MPIDLAQPRVFAFQDRKRQFTLTVKPITKQMWLKYFAGIVNMQETKDGDTVTNYDSTGARLELLEAALIDATGYLSDDRPITGMDGWQAKLPMAHRRAVADLLVAVEPMPLDEESFIDLGFETVVLKSTWTAGENGKMQELAGLKHVFRSPTADHQKRYSRAMSRSVVVGGSRTGQTRWLGAQDVLIEIYDELLSEVAGYCYNGKEFSSSAELLPVMDSYHKVAAVTALFTPVEVAAA